jgi:thymidylate synthase (FAD)
MTAQEELADRLVTDGVPTRTVNAAIALMRTGRADLINKVIAGRLTVFAALELARDDRPGPQRMIKKPAPWGQEGGLSFRTRDPECRHQQGSVFMNSKQNGRSIPVLDHDLVRLVDSMGTDLSVVRAARVSYDAAWRPGENEESNTRLIKYLWTHKHTTPFESVGFTFEVKAPIFVLRQWHRHRTQSYNELSARYRPLPDEFYVPDAAVVGVQSKTNKQGRAAGGDPALREEQIEAYREACQRAFALYRGLLACEWPRELARLILPVSVYSSMLVTMNLLNLLRFLTLRCAPDAQWEIQQYANALADLAESVTPVCIRVWRGGQQ